VARTLRYLADQTIAERIELILVLLDGATPEGDPPDAVGRLAGHRFVPAPDARSIAEANAAGVRPASAPIVALGEDHAFPEPGWAEALVARHEEPWAVVGPVVRNANPDTLVSWADYALSYASFAVGQPGGDVGFVPGHNSSYKRAVLERQGDGLSGALAAEWVFHLRLREQGEGVYLEPDAVLAHVNFSKLRPFLVHAFRGGRSHAAIRAMHWSAMRRLVYALGSPVLPALRGYRVARALPPAQRRLVPALALPVALLGLVVDAAGQAVGFARANPAYVHGDLLKLELERVRYVSAADAAALW
jgi:GT2 family glycosyltransferase